MTSLVRTAFSCMLAAAVLTSCIGDSGAVLKGRVLVDGEPSDSNCKLSLYAADTGLLLQTAQIGGTFDELFVIEPGEHDYYVTISCAGVAEQYRSSTLRLGSLEVLETGTDLGTVSLSRAVE